MSHNCEDMPAHPQWIDSQSTGCWFMRHQRDFLQRGGGDSISWRWVELIKGQLEMDRVHSNGPGSQQPTPQAHKSLLHQLLWMVAPQVHLTPSPTCMAVVFQTPKIIHKFNCLVNWLFFFLIAFSLMDGAADGIVDLSGQMREWAGETKNCNRRMEGNRSDKVKMAQIVVKEESGNSWDERGGWMRKGREGKKLGVEEWIHARNR